MPVAFDGFVAGIEAGTEHSLLAGFVARIEEQRRLLCAPINDQQRARFHYAGDVEELVALAERLLAGTFGGPLHDRHRIADLLHHLRAPHGVLIGRKDISEDGLRAGGERNKSESSKLCEDEFHRLSEYCHHNPMNLKGTSIIGRSHAAASGKPFHAVNAATGEQLEPGFHGATSGDLEAAAQLAAAAFPKYRALARGKRAGFLRQIASNLEGLGDALIHRVMAESALPEGRVRGELARTCGQLRFFAGIVEEGSWVDARLDLADPDRKPLPRADLRSMLRPLGPVAVFCASNFPLGVFRSRRRHRVGVRRGLPGDCEGSFVSFRYGRDVRRGDSRCRRTDRHARRHLLSSLHQRPRDRSGAGGASRHQGRRIHGLARRRTEAARDRAIASRAYPVLCRDEQRQPGLHSSSRAGTARRADRRRLVRLHHARRGPILYQPGNRAAPARARAAMRWPRSWAKRFAPPRRPRC